MVLNYAGDENSVTICCVMRNKGRIDALLDQRSCNASIEGINVLDYAGLDGPFPPQLLIELIESCTFDQLIFLGLPNTLERFKLTVGQAPRVRWQVGDRLPFV